MLTAILHIRSIRHDKSLIQLLGHLLFLPVIGHAFFHAQPRWGRALSAVQRLGLDLRQPGHRVGTVAGDLAAAAGVLLVAGLALARGIVAAAAHGLSRL